MLNSSRSKKLVSTAACGSLSSLVLGTLISGTAHAQPPSATLDAFRNTVGDRVEAVTILGGDFGVSGGAYNKFNDSTKKVSLNSSKFGGYGEIGDPQPLGDLGIGWQPILQGNLGYLTAKNNFQSGPLNGDTSEYKTFAIQFGGGARFWFDDHFSIASTFMGMYGNTENSYTANSVFAQQHQNQARELGLIDWNANTWTVRPALNFQYTYTWRRTIFTLSSSPTYFYTESFTSSSPNVNVNGGSTTWENKLDIDTPLGVECYGHEVRTGGFFSRTDLYGDISDGLQTDYIYEAHGRIVLDFLDQLWKVQWLGIGVSYMWGSNFDGWAYGVDAAFRF